MNAPGSLAIAPIITVTVTRFVELTSATGSPFFSAATLALAGPPHPNLRVGHHPVSHRQSVRVFGRGGGAPADLPGGITLSFQILSIEQISYQPLGLSFLQLAPTAAHNDPDGTATFDHASVSISGDTIQITDHWQQRHGPGAAFEFFLLIRRTTDGKVGIIDPMIENEN